ncbi:hypothetical protein GTA24_21645 [Roseobacter sp. HKCCD8418]|nr:hypothetical protein [Roseobacter sp. HKCCD8418]
MKSIAKITPICEPQKYANSITITRCRPRPKLKQIDNLSLDNIEVEGKIVLPSVRKV